MKFDKKAAQNQLDLAAEELENAGFADLAEKIDYYSYRLTQASATEIPLIKRALSRIRQEAQGRLNKFQKNKPTEKINKAKAATLHARRSSAVRKATLKRRLKTIIAKREHAMKKLEVLRSARQTRRNSKEERKQQRKARISKTK